VGFDHRQTWSLDFNQAWLRLMAPMTAVNSAGTTAVDEMACRRAAHLPIIQPLRHPLSFAAQTVVRIPAH